MNRKNLRGTIRSLLARAIEKSGMIDGSINAIEHKLQDWVSRGRRYDEVAGDLEGPGALILLSSDMDSM